MIKRFLAALAALLCVGVAFADKPETKPYAAGAPYGGIPLWEPGDRFVAISGGSCAGTCPVYELYVFEDGRVKFSGRKDTRRTGIATKQVSPEVYAELVGYGLSGRHRSLQSDVSAARASALHCSM